MNRVHFKRIVASLLIIGAWTSTSLSAQNLLIKNARVHTVTARGTLDNTDVLIRAGRIHSIDNNLSADRDSNVIDANGRALTPGLFAGIAPIGLVEISQEETSVDTALILGQSAYLAPVMRPEFNPTLAYNPHASAVAVNRLEGLTFAMLGASTGDGGSIIAGSGAAVSLNGNYQDQALLPDSQALFVYLGGAAHSLAGKSRAGQYMLLEQAFREARSSAKALRNETRLLTISGREVLAQYLNDGRMIISVNRAADILQVLSLAAKHRFRAIIYGGAEAWMVADQLVAAKVPVILNPLNNLPSSFDQIGAAFTTAKRLHDAGVEIIFSLNGDAHNTRKVRQAAGNAVAHGLPWDAALKALTATPARVFQQDDRIGTIATGKQADLVLWSGDPLEVTSAADAVWINGQAMPMRSRQTLLRDRYLPANPQRPRQYIKP